MSPSWCIAQTVMNCSLGIGPRGVHRESVPRRNIGLGLGGTAARVSPGTSPRPFSCGRSPWEHFSHESLVVHRPDGHGLPSGDRSTRRSSRIRSQAEHQRGSERNISLGPGGPAAQNSGPEQQPVPAQNRGPEQRPGPRRNCGPRTAARNRRPSGPDPRAPAASVRASAGPEARASTTFRRPVAADDPHRS